MKNKKILLLGIATLFVVLTIVLINNPLFTQANKPENQTLESTQMASAVAVKTEANIDQTSDLNLDSDSNLNSDTDLNTNLSENKDDKFEFNLFEDMIAAYKDSMDKNKSVLYLNSFEAMNDSIRSSGNLSKNAANVEPVEEKPKYNNVIYGQIGDHSADQITIGISVADPYVFIREQPNTESLILGKLKKGAAAAIIKTKGDWTLIESGTVRGYVKTEYLNTSLSMDKIIEKYGILQAIIDTDGLNVRKKASTKSKRLTVVYSNEIYPVIKTKDEWLKIYVKDDHIKGFITTEYVKLIVNFNQAISLEEEQALKRLEEEEARKAAQTSNPVKESTQTSSSNKKTQTTANNTSSNESSKPNVVNKPAKNYSDEDLKLLACLVHAESGNQSYEGKLAVANVVLNRVKSSKFPGSIKNVIYESGQFTVTSSGSLQKQLDNYNNYTTTSQRLSIDAAKSALEGNNNIGDRLYFNRYSNERAENHPDSKRIQGHLFW